VVRRLRQDDGVLPPVAEARREDALRLAVRPAGVEDGAAELEERLRQLLRPAALGLRPFRRPEDEPADLPSERFETNRAHGPED